MRALVIFLGSLALGFAAAWPYHLFEKQGDNRARDDEMGRFHAVFLPDEPTTDNFDITIEVKGEFAAVPPDAAVRIFCQAEDTANYTAMEVSAQRVRLLDVAGGRCRELARWEGNTAAQGAFPTNLRLRRRAPQIDAICDGRKLLSTICEPARRGKVGAGAVGVNTSTPLLQAAAPVIFTDDFMRAPDENGAWLVAGEAEWQVRSLANPARSSNAFVFLGKGEKGGCALVGREHWDRYQAEVAVLGSPQGEIGLIIAAADTAPRLLPSRYALVRWSAEPRPSSQTSAAVAGRLEIVQSAGGRETVLASRPGGYRVGRWYRLGARLANNRITALIDGRPVLDAASPWFSGGGAGLYVKAAEPAEFDDFTITPLAALGGDEFTRLPWSFLSGQWQVDGNVLQWWPAAVFPSFAIAGGEWEDVDLSCRLESLTAAVGIIAAFREPGCFIAYVVDPQAAEERILQVKRGGETVLARGAWQAASPELRLRIDRGLIQGGSLTAFLGEPLNGRAGVAVFGGGSREPLVFTAFSAVSLPPPRLVSSVNEIFDDEELMAIWAGSAGDWQAERNTAGFEQLYWHRSSFPGDAEIEALLPQAQPEKWQVGLSLAKSGGGKGYILFLQADAGETQLRLLRDGEEVAKRILPANFQFFRCALRRAGSWLIGVVNDQPLLMWNDPSPLAGSGAAWAAKGLRLEPAAVNIHSRTLHDENFNRAPADWRPAGGVWMVANRWECDPRWSFVAGMPPALAERRLQSFGRFLPEEARWSAEMLQGLLALVPDRQSKLAALWHKGEFAGDLVVECFVAQMMDNTRGGGDYRRYVQNFCLTICADGRDLDSGYSCLFGAEGNTKSQIRRGREVVAESRAAIPVTANIHRKWFRLRAEKRGADISFTAFTQEQRDAPERQLMALSFHDPAPLAGKRIAIWTWDNGIMVARARIACGLTPQMEDPFFVYPEEARCVYVPLP